VLEGFHFLAAAGFVAVPVPMHVTAVLAVSVVFSMPVVGAMHAGTVCAAAFATFAAGFTVLAASFAVLTAAFAVFAAGLAVLAAALATVFAAGLAAHATAFAPFAGHLATFAARLVAFANAVCGLALAGAFASGVAIALHGKYGHSAAYCYEQREGSHDEAVAHLSIHRC
jgi:hypothetical protein